ncbi:MAG: hypothetical protein P1V35_17545, partial [Planctomycetota bacterium]|nr:hypothetical protein [Planctomycetota bacterium]
MHDPNMTLVYLPLLQVVEELAGDPTSAGAWSKAQQTLTHHGVTSEDDEELSDTIELQDSETLAAIVTGWTSGDRLMLERDRAVLKRAMKAYRKTLKVTILAAETTLGGGATSTGRSSGIVGVIPPDRYPTETWNELVRQKRLLDGGRG